LKDAQGRGLPGAVSAIMIDAHGGGSLGGLHTLDTRGKLCGEAGVDAQRCDRFVDGDPTLEALRRAALGDRGGGLQPVSDPAGRMKEEMNKAFRDVVHSLEGAVFEATESAE